MLFLAFLVALLLGGRLLLVWLFRTSFLFRVITLMLLYSFFSD